MAVRHAGIGPTINPTRYMFIDGGCVREACKRLAERFGVKSPISIDYGPLAEMNAFKKVFFYDAVPSQERSEEPAAYDARVAPQLAQHAVLRRLPGWHVYEGDLKRSLANKNRRQKKVDILIAVDMLLHTVRGNMHEAALIAGDLDFEPLLNALVHEGMYVTLHYPPDRAIPELLASADAAEPLTLLRLASMISVRGEKPLERIEISPFEQSAVMENAVLVAEAGGRLRLFRSPDRHFIQIDGDRMISCSSGEFLLEAYAQTYGVSCDIMRHDGK